MRVVAISGSSGFIGTALAHVLVARGDRVKRLVRHAARDDNEIAWDPARGEIDVAALNGVDAVVNLAGEKIDQRWTNESQAAIRQSRVQATSLLARAISSMTVKPRAFLSGSAIGIYGNRGDEVLDESSALGDDFLASVCKDWEAAALPASGAGIRVVHLRTGIVFAKHGGALHKLLLPFRFGVGGKLGSGKQWMSWIALADMAAAIAFLLDAEQVVGAVNMTAPHPLTNEELTRALGDELHRPTFASVPRFALELALGKMADDTVLASQRVLPRRLLDAGFTFTFPAIEPFLAAELS